MGMSCGTGDLFVCKNCGKTFSINQLVSIRGNPIPQKNSNNVYISDYRYCPCDKGMKDCCCMDKEKHGEMNMKGKSCMVDMKKEMGKSSEASQPMPMK